MRNFLSSVRSSDRNNSLRLDLLMPVFGLILILVCLGGSTSSTGTETDNSTTRVVVDGDGCTDGKNGLFFCPDDRTIEMLDNGEIKAQDIKPIHSDFEQAIEMAAKDRERDWTILFYDDADFGPGYDPIVDFTNDAYSADNLDIILLQDTMGGPAYYWHIEGGGSRTVIESLGEVDMGDYTTLRDFIQYGKANYPADRYLLCAYDHGGGHQGACIDQSEDPTTVLSMDDFEVAITENGGVDIIAFTAPCLMGSVEAVYELRDCVDVYVGSEDLSGYALWHGIFHDICDLLVDSDTVTNEEIGIYMVELISENTYWPQPENTMSASSSANVGELAQNISELADYLNSNIAAFSSSIEAAREATWVVADYYYDDFTRVDLYDAIQKIGGYVFDFWVGQKVTTILELFSETVIAEWHGSYQTGAHGLSIYYPRLGSSYNEAYHTSAVSFADDLGWDDFLRAYYAGAPTAVGEYLGETGLNAGNSPNPFQHSTSIRFSNRQAGNVSLKVFDISGRHIRTLCNEPFDPGPHSLIWDGCDSQGQQAASGTYFYQIETEGQSAMKRMVLIR